MNEERFGEFLGEFREFRGEVREGLKNLDEHVKAVSHKAGKIGEECRAIMREHERSPASHGLDKEEKSGNTIRGWMSLIVAVGALVWSLLK